MNNPYLEDMKYTEIAIAAEDFNYNSYVKCNIPSLYLKDGDFIKTQEHRMTFNNIMNDDMSVLDYGEVNVVNYIELYIPSLYSNGESVGKKGTKFIVNFCGGDQANINICGRYYDNETRNL